MFCVMNMYSGAHCYLYDFRNEILVRLG